ncbi:MAG TPA: triose-phosphate isomerase [Candidatus Moranbacteria bacterium]|nr:triose-phosphate isomerase [Candidatus Moranbacteria bacterium]
MQKLIIANLKMNLLTLSERERYLESFKKELKNKNISDTEIVLCPPAVHIENFVKNNKSKAIAVGAQNIFWEERGSFTGEISAAMVKNIGAKYVIIGHSERKKYFSEDNRIANAKIRIALKNGLVPVYCIGETKEERLSGNTVDVIMKQMVEGLDEISSTKIQSIVLVYEPVWAVGSDEIPTGNEILEAKILIKKLLSHAYGPEIANKIKILYGGSVKAKTAEQVCLEPGMDGVLVGRESLVPSEFLKIAETINEQKKTE